MSEEMVMAMICEKMGWTYSEYVNQPDWFLQLLIMKFGADAEHQNRLNKELKHASK